MRRSAGIKILPLLFLALSFITGSASPQSIWLDQNLDRALYLEIQKPNFTKEYLGGGFFTKPMQTTLETAVVFLSTHWRFSRLLALHVEFPFMNVGFQDHTVILPTYSGSDTVTFPSNSENWFGNPLVGLELNRKNSFYSFAIGIRLPLRKTDESGKISSANAEGYGFLIDYDRFEAFLSDTWAFAVKVEYQYEKTTGLLLQLRAGPTLFKPTNNYYKEKLFADYGAHVGYKINRVRMLGGLTGRAYVNESGLNFGQRTVHQLGFSANYSFEHLIPGLNFRIPLDDDLKRDLDFVFGVNLAYRLP